MSNTRSILVVEDNPADQKLIKMALGEVDMPLKLHFVRDGKIALDYLINNFSFRPDLIILDQNMPCMDGFEFLNAIRENEDLKDIKIAMFSTTPFSRAARSVTRHEADKYLAKPFDVDEYIKIIAVLCQEYIGAPANKIN